MLHVKDIMTQDVFVLHANDDLDLVQTLIKNRHTRYIPIVDNEGLFVGLITHRDLLSLTVSRLATMNNNGHEGLNGHVPIRKIMQNGIMTADPEMNLGTAVSILLKNTVGCLPVVLKRKLVGILTEADFLKLTFNYLRIFENDPSSIRKCNV
jgi:CBS domain-containing membrane protein